MAESTPENPPAPESTPPSETSDPVGVETPKKPEAKDAEQNIDISGGEVHNNQFIALQNNYISQDPAYSYTVFDAQTMATCLSAEEQENHALQYIHDRAQTDPLAKQLGEQHLLAVQGEFGSGRLALAKFLAWKLPWQLECIVVRPLGQAVRIDLEREVRKHQNRVWIFEDALLHRNRDVQDFFLVLHEQTLRELTKQNSYIIFTLDTDSTVPQRPDNNIRLVAPMPALAPEKLLEGFELHLTQRGRGSSLLKEERQAIANQAGSIPRIFNFIDNHLDKLETEKQALGEDANNQFEQRVAEVINEVKNLDSWFFNDLAKDFEQWFFTLVAVLMQGTASSDGVPWVEFQALRADLRDAVRGHLGRARRIEAYYDKGHIIDSALLKPSRTQVERDQKSTRDRLKFTKADVPERLWMALLAQSKVLLSALLPRLRELARQNEDFMLRAHAARIIGRIGEIDPKAFALDLLDEEAKEEAYWRNSTVGYVLEGALSSRDPGYRGLCLAWLDRMGRHGKRTETRTAIIACKTLGLADLPLAIKHLKTIVETRLAGQFAQWQKILRKHRSAAVQNASGSRGDWLNSLYYGLRILGLQAEEQAIIDDIKDKFYVFQYTLVALCINLDLVRVFAALSAWLDHKQDGFRAALFLALLAEGGVIDSVGTFLKAPSADMGAEATGSTVIVVALLADADAPQRVADFLEKLYTHLDAGEGLSADFAKPLKRLFKQHLLAWVTNAGRSKSGQQALAELFAKLRGTPLREQIEGLLDDAVFSDPDKHLGRFPLMVRVRS